MNPGEHAPLKLLIRGFGAAGGFADTIVLVFHYASTAACYYPAATVKGLLTGTPAECIDRRRGGPYHGRGQKAQFAWRPPHAGAPPVMPFFVKRVTVRVPAAGSPVQAVPRRPVDDLLRDADAHAFGAKLDQGRWHRLHVPLRSAPAHRNVFAMCFALMHDYPAPLGQMDLIGPLITQIPWACQDDPAAAFEGARARALAAMPASR